MSAASFRLLMVYFYDEKFHKRIQCSACPQDQTCRDAEYIMYDTKRSLDTGFCFLGAGSFSSPLKPFAFIECPARVSERRLQFSQTGLSFERTMTIHPRNERNHIRIWTMSSGKPIDSAIIALLGIADQSPLLVTAMASILETHPT